jgi:hypothetical protein
MKTFSLLFFSFISLAGFSQAPSKGVNIGDTIWIGQCTGNTVYKYIDAYSQTRITDTAAKYDTATGDGFLNYFFKNGDLDGKRLKCDAPPRFAFIAAVEEVQEKNTANYKQVLIAWLNKKEKRVLWIEIEPALASGEVYLK